MWIKDKLLKFWNDSKCIGTYADTLVIWGIAFLVFGVIFLICYSCGWIKSKKQIEMELLENKCPKYECPVQKVDGFIIPEAKINVKYNIEGLRFERIHLKSVRLTAYNNHPNQTSSSPNTFASGRIVYEGGVAISQDILDKYQLKYGDLVYIPKMGSYFVYEDKMAYGRKDGERTIKNTVDIFMFSYDTAKTFHHPTEDVIIYKLVRNQ